MTVCSHADGRSRDFTSLASKALWLSYPHDVPIFDSFVQRALWVIAKLEDGGMKGPTGGSEYRRFIHMAPLLLLPLHPVTSLAPAKEGWFRDLSQRGCYDPARATSVVPINRITASLFFQ
jgi:hypothetical protein